MAIEIARVMYANRSAWLRWLPLLLTATANVEVPGPERGEVDSSSKEVTRDVDAPLTENEGAAWNQCQLLLA